MDFDSGLITRYNVCRMVNKQDTKSTTEPIDTNEDVSLPDTPDVVSDDTLEATAQTPSAATPPPDTLQAEIQAARDQMQRMKADFLNARRRLEEDRHRDAIRHQITFITSLLPLCDSFQMALQSKTWESADAAWKQGIEAVHTQLQTVLKQYNVLPIDQVGVPYNPSQHEAIGTEPVSDASKQDTVVHVVQRGYVLLEDQTEHLIRPARVTTGEYTTDASNHSDE